ERAVDRLEAARERAIDRVDDRLPIDPERDGLAEPRRTEQRVGGARVDARAALRVPLTELDVLEVVTGELVERDPGRALERLQIEAERRRDRVHLAAAHRLLLGVRVGDELEVDLLDL